MTDETQQKWVRTQSLCRPVETDVHRRRPCRHGIAGALAGLVAGSLGCGPRIACERVRVNGMRVAAIDAGTNTTRLLVAEVQEGGLTHVERRRGFYRARGGR